MNYSKLFFALILLSASACVRDGVTLSYGLVKNESTAKIRISAYSKGQILDNFNFDLENQSNRDITTNPNMGIGTRKNAGFNNESLSISDSIVVLYNDSFSVTHYRDSPTVFAPKYYLPQNPRCFMNIANWDFEFVEESKTKVINYYNFTFTKQDYLDAKD